MKAKIIGWSLFFLMFAVVYAILAGTSFAADKKLATPVVSPPVAATPVVAAPVAATPVVAAPVTPPLPQPVPPRYRHIFDEEGKLLATIDTKDGVVEYKESPKLVAELMVRRIEALSSVCFKKIEELETKLVEKK